jgi:hypothetical protein
MYRSAGRGDLQRLFRLTHEKLVFCIAEACKHALMLFSLKHNLERNCKAKDKLHEIYGLNNNQIYEFNLLFLGGAYLAQLQQAGQSHLPGLISCSSQY